MRIRDLSSDVCSTDLWTPQGRNLTTYLAEASAASPDCVEAAKMLVLSEAPWIPKSTPLRKEWTDFLKVVGVKDGLPLLADETVPKTGSPIYVWKIGRASWRESVCQYV